LERLHNGLNEVLCRRRDRVC